jgi:hypothetical protein
MYLAFAVNPSLSSSVTHGGVGRPRAFSSFFVTILFAVSKITSAEQPVYLMPRHSSIAGARKISFPFPGNASTRLKTNRGFASLMLIIASKLSENACFITV